MAVDTRRRETNVAEGAESLPMPSSTAADAAAVLESVVIQGDLSRLQPAERVSYYKAVCESLGLNPYTKPFDYINLPGRGLILYAKKDATEQLRAIRHINVTDLDRARDEQLGLYVVVAHGSDRTGRQDSSLGAVSIQGLRGEALANAMMKAETKAKRRLTLSLAGLGWLDEVEVEGISRVDVDPATGEVKQAPESKALVDRIGEVAERLEAEPEEPASVSETASEAEKEPERTPDAPPQACGAPSPFEGGAFCLSEPGHKGVHRAENESWPQK